jgi:hypothetical protein
MALRNGGGGGACPAAVVLVAAAVAALLGAGVAATKFDDVVQPSWANDHVVYDGDLLKLRLDSNSGGGFVSRTKFLYGKASADLKLVPGDSAGVVTAFYVSECCAGIACRFHFQIWLPISILLVCKRPKTTRIYKKTEKSKTGRVKKMSCSESAWPPIIR